ncbi:MAG: TIGR02221 family CRISPR-associated protein, partial [Halothiobacillus sp.]|nr:TIGR02221 family CRISPR-associated protein [Halothiobacillus sp.]
MSTALLTVLGKSSYNPKTGYREATYQFPDGSQRKTPYFGLALADYLKPDAIIILGTAGSMWGVMLEHYATEGDNEHLRIELIEAEANANVTQELLDRLTPLLTQVLGYAITPRLIPQGANHTEQIEILRIIADTMGKQQSILHFDL